MGAARHLSRAVSAVLPLSLLAPVSTYSQGEPYPRASGTGHALVRGELWMERCSGRLPELAASSFNPAAEEPLFPSSGQESHLLSDGGDLGCATHEAMTAYAPRTIVAAEANPCLPRMAADSRISRVLPCQASAQPAPAELSALGKAGEQIARAREEVLNILASENACTQWFESKDAAPATTFQSLNFSVDRHGPENILEWQQSGALFMSRQPYVAQSTQDGGPHTQITINANGAFYRSQGTVQKLLGEGGPRETEGARLLTVGSYTGNTLEAQILTLLHEFGHIVDLLPEDGGDGDGKSARNTREVLLHCRAEVESRSKEARHVAKK